MNSGPLVFDCNVYAQALINPRGPAGECVEAALEGKVLVCLSRFLVNELRKLPGNPTMARFRMPLERADQLLAKLRPLAVFIEVPPVVFEHPIDPKDGPYIDLAVAAGANVITSRDKHLLNLTNPGIPWSADFRARFPWLRVMSPQALLKELRESTGEQTED